MSETPLERLKTRFPHWQSQSELLLNLLGQHAPKIFIPGPRDHDKPLFIRELLALHDLRVAYVRGSEFFWDRGAFFEHICNQLSLPSSFLRSVHPTYSAGSGVIWLPKARLIQQKIPTIAVFVEKLKDIFLRLNPPERACILVEDVDKLDLKTFGENILSVFLRLEELTSVPIGVVMTASCEWASVQSEFPAQNPMIVRLPSPLQPHLVQSIRQGEAALPKTTHDRLELLKDLWLERCVPRGWNTTRELYNLFVFNIVQGLRIAYPTKRELQIISFSLFPRYLEPVLVALESGAELPSSVELYTNIAPFFQVIKDTTSLMFLGEEIEAYESKKTGRSSSSNTTAAMDFPLICKYLLLSGWIAARNPNIDAEIKDRRRRRKGGKSEASRLEEEAFAPPSSWRIDKLLSILDHILAGNEEEDVKVAVDTSTTPKESAEDAELKMFQSQFNLSSTLPNQTITSDSSSTTQAALTSADVATSNASNSITKSTAETRPISALDALKMDVDEKTRAMLEADFASGALGNMEDFDGGIELGDEDGIELSGDSELNFEGIEVHSEYEFGLEELEGDFLPSEPSVSQQEPEPITEFEFIPDSVHFDSVTLFPLLWEAKQGHAGQLEIISQIAVLEQIGLFIRLAAGTSKTNRGRSEYKCGYDWEFVREIATSINFPLWGFI